MLTENKTNIRNIGEDRMNRTFHCLFEQSGTFKNEFKKLGYQAIDYDIQDEFRETDYICDLFVEIERAYKNEESIFDDIKQEDTIIAFFLAYDLKAKSNYTLEELVRA